MQLATTLREDLLPETVAIPVQYKPEPEEHDFALEFIKQQNVRTCGKQWFIEKNGCLREVTRDSFRPIALALLPIPKRKERAAQNILDHVESLNQIDDSTLRGALAFDDAGAILINALNGIVRVDQTSVELLPHEGARLFTRCLSAAYDESAACPTFEHTLRQCLPDTEDQQLLQLLAGNFLWPDCRFEVAAVCYGEAGSGKSTTAEAISNVLGDELVTRLSMSQICDPKCYSLAKLRYAAVNLGTELDSLAVDESGNFKTLVSGEPIEARPIYGHPFTMRSHCKLWFLANGLPRFKNGTEAELRRTRFLRFEFKPVQPDVTLKQRLNGERSGVLNFMLTGLQHLFGCGTIPLGGKQSRGVHERFRISNDPIGSFIQQCCGIDPETKVRKDSLAGAFKEFCEENNLPFAFNDHFLKKLWDRCPELVEVRHSVNGSRIRFVQGLHLKTGFGD